MTVPNRRPAWRLLLAFVSILVLSESSGAQIVQFAPFNYAAGAGPASIAVADFTRDGKLDLAVADSQSGDVALLPGLGSVFFRTAVRSPAGANPLFLASADFNGDGNPDLVAATSAGIAVLLGNGDGTFRAPVNTPVAGQPAALVVADFNGDGKPDVATADSTGGDVAILLGVGNGLFQAPLKFAAGSGPQSLAVADFNNDGKPDLVVANASSGSISVLLSIGNGFFQPAINTSTGGQPRSIAVADFNGDGIPDVVVADAQSGNVVLLLGVGRGVFQGPRTFAAGASPQFLLVADLNGDGKPDISVADAGSGAVAVLLGLGGGFFKPALNFTVGTDPVSIALGDFNGDGKPDLAVANRLSTGNNITVLINGQGSGGTPPPGTVTSVSAADGSPALAPESIASAYGSGLAPATASAASLPLPTSLGGVTLQVTDSAGITRQAPLFYVSASQINYEIPAGTALGQAAVTVLQTGGGSVSGTAQIQNIAPALFSADQTGKGVAAGYASQFLAGGAGSATLAISQCASAGPGALSCVSVPVSLGIDTPVFLSLFGSGIRNRSALANVACTIGGITVPVTYAGPQGTFEGEDQVNIGLTLNLRGIGETNLVLTVDGIPANTVRINIQ